MAGHVALVTCLAARGLDSDEPLLLAALDALDIDVEVLDWDRPADWSVYDLAVIRSTWDYATRHSEFLAWAGATGEVTNLHNPVAMLSWNTDKHYLTTLAERGLPVIETTFLAPGSAWPDEKLVGSLVVKPSVSAGGQDTARYGPQDHQQAREHVGRLHAQQRVAMVQPYLERIESSEETGLIYIGGTFSHATAKGSLLQAGAAETGLFAPETVAARRPSPAERALGDATLGLVSDDLGMPLYARVDLLPDADGLPRILEVELTEPSLWLETDPDAADRMAAAVAGLLER